MPEIAAEQRVYDSPAPKAANAGRWIDRAPLPLPRSEMAWAAKHAGRMHLVGGYGEQRVDRPYHHVYDPATDRWLDAAPLPRGANHVGVAVLDGRLYAIGGFTEQNRKPHDECFVWEAGGDRWQKIASLPRACGAIALVAIDGRLHAVGGAIGDTFETKRSVDWHLAYDPAPPEAPLRAGRRSKSTYRDIVKTKSLGERAAPHLLLRDYQWRRQRDGVAGDAHHHAELAEPRSIAL